MVVARGQPAHSTSKPYTLNNSTSNDQKDKPHHHKSLVTVTSSSSNRHRHGWQLLQTPAAAAV